MGIKALTALACLVAFAPGIAAQEAETLTNPEIEIAQQQEAEPEIFEAKPLVIFELSIPMDSVDLCEQMAPDFGLFLTGLNGKPLKMRCVKITYEPADGELPMRVSPPASIRDAEAKPQEAPSRPETKVSASHPHLRGAL